MKRLFRKNQIIITSLAIMIVIAGYLNFTADQTKPVKQEAAAETAEKIRLSVNEDVSSDSYGCPTEVSMHVLSEDGMEADNGSKKQFRQLLSQQLGMAESQIHFGYSG